VEPAEASFHNTSSHPGMKLGALGRSWFPGEKLILREEVDH
jgi:hypothetical protein